MGFNFYLVNFYGYYEIINNQYHYLLNVWTLLLLFGLYLNINEVSKIFFLLMGLLIKPIGLIWTIPLILNKHYKVILFSVLLFLLISFPFYLNGIGKYYFDNLSYNIVNSNYANWNLFYIFAYFNISNIPIYEIKLITASLIIMFCLVFRVNTIKSVILWILYVLFMYQNNFPYHFSIISIIFPLGILFKFIKINFISVVNMIVLAIPVPFMQFLSEKLLFINSDIDTNKKLLLLVWAYLGLILFCYNLVFSIIRKEKDNYVKLQFSSK